MFLRVDPNKLRMPGADEALPGRAERTPVPERHFVNGNLLIPPWPEGMRMAWVRKHPAEVELTLREMLDNQDRATRNQAWPAREVLVRIIDSPSSRSTSDPEGAASDRRPVVVFGRPVVGLFIGDVLEDLDRAEPLLGCQRG